MMTCTQNPFITTATKATTINYNIKPHLVIKTRCWHDRWNNKISRLFVISIYAG